MAKLSAQRQVFDGDTTVVDTTAKYPVLSRGYDVNSKEYIYLGGVASTVAGSVVGYDEVGSTTLTVSATVGPIAVAMAANTSPSGYGWYQIYGLSFVKAAASIAADSQIYKTATAGFVDDADVTTDFIVNMMSLAAGDSD